jgi:hypothetical protein
MSLAPLSILGIGAVTPLGRNLDAIGQELQRTATTSLRKDLQSIAAPPKPVEPERSVLRSTSEPACGVLKSSLNTPTPRLAPLRVDDAILPLDPALGAQMRRADRFTRMAVAAATDAWNAARQGCAGIGPERIGLFLCSGFGPHCRGFRFLDGILDMGDTAASPTDFSHSVHGAASAYISRLLDLRGPSLNSTDFEIGFEEAIRVAQCWLDEGACDRVLLGAVEELGEVYLHCASRMLGDAAGIRPSEGAAFFVLARHDVPGVARLSATAEPAAVDLLVVEDPVVLPVASAATSAPDAGSEVLRRAGFFADGPGSCEYFRTGVWCSAISAKQTVTFTPSFGHCASATAFNLLGASLALRSDPSIDTAATVRTSSEGRLVTLLLER